MNKLYKAFIKLVVLLIFLVTYAALSASAIAEDRYKADKSIEINAPIEEVFSYTTDPKNLHMLMPNMRVVSNISPPTPSLGQHWDWEYKWFVTTLRGKSRVVEFVPTGRYVVQSEKDGAEGSPDLWIYTLSKKDMGTRVALQVEYTISKSSIVTKVMNWVFIERKINGEVQNSLEKLKTIMENSRHH